MLVLACLSGMGMLAHPLLPVTQRTATYTWEGSGITALPLTPYRPERLTITLDCARVGPDAGPVLGTVRAVDEGMQAARLDLAVRGGEVQVTSRGPEGKARTVVTAAAYPCEKVQVIVDSDELLIWSGGDRPVAHRGDLRPAIDSLTIPDTMSGVHVEVVADTQFDTYPSPLKIGVGIGSAVLLLVVLGLVIATDRPRRPVDRSLRRPGPADAVVLAATVFGVLAGGATDDDGFIAQIIRTPAMDGYVGNYVRWNNVPEAPFGWFYNVAAQWGTISMEPVWLRLPPAALGLAAWFVLSQMLLPRFLPRAGRWPRVAMAAGFTLLWLVFCNSLRPEIYFALGLGLVICCVEDALHRRSTWPLVVGAIIASLTVGTGPTGLVAVVPFVVAVRPLYRWVKSLGWAGLAVATAWLAGLGSVVLLMFADQSWASVVSATHARNEFGPIYPVWEDYQRYWKLWWSFAARQFSVYVPVVAFAYLAWHLWRRRQLPGLNRRLTLQVVGGALGLVVVLLLGPTKLPHHFGALLLIGPLALAGAVHLLARVRQPGPRITAVLLGGSIVVVGLAMHNNNMWWKLSTLGLLLDRNPLAIGPVPLWPAVALGGLGVGWLVIRRIRAAGPPRWWVPAYALGLVLLSLSQYANFAWAAIDRGPNRYTMANASLSAIRGVGGDGVGGDGEGCLLERSLFEEPDPAAGVLTPESGADPFPAPVTSGLRAWPADNAAPDSLTTPWYPVPDDVRSGQWPLVIAVSGIDEGHRVRVQYDTGGERQLTPTRKTLATSDLSDIRLHPDSEATRFRIIAESDGPAVADPKTGVVTPFVVAQPRVPVTRPLLALAEEEQIAVAWNLAFFFPCLDTPAIDNGRVTIPDYIVSDSEQPGNMTYHSRSGGPFAGVLGLTVPSRVPIYAAFDYTEADMSALDLVRLVPDFDTDLTAVELGTRQRSGWEALPVIP